MGYFVSIFLIIFTCLVISALIGPGLARSIVLFCCAGALLVSLPIYAIWFFLDPARATHSPVFWGVTICLLGLAEWLKGDK